MKQKGLIIVNTGNGKGKTTAALGLCMRALGHKFRVCVLQFIKGSWKYGELDAFKTVSDSVDFHVLGKGFLWDEPNEAENKRIATQAWEFAKSKIQSNHYDLIVLDEITYLMNFRLISEQEVIQVITQQKENQHIVITGREASDQLIQCADIVTEMKEIKHAFSQGIKAQKGIEF